MDQQQGKSLGRAELVVKLRERGLSRREAVRILNFIFAEIKKALKRGREVEFAGGRLKRVKRSFGRYWEAIGDYPANRQLYTVEWQPDAEPDAGAAGKGGPGPGGKQRVGKPENRSTRDRNTGK
jgi:hypothetical protein